MWLQREFLTQTEKSAQEAHQKGLEELSEITTKLGRLQLSFATRALQIVDKEFTLWEAELSGKTTKRKANHAMVIALLRLIPTLRIDGADAWAKALQVDKLLTQLEQDSAKDDLPTGIEWTRVVAGSDDFELDDEKAALSETD